MRRCVDICNDVVLKTDDPKSMRMEAEKTRRARNIADSCGLFRVPKVLAYDESTGQIKFQFLHSLSSIKDVLNSGDTYKPIMRNIGQALAVIHKELTLPDEMKFCLPQEYNLSSSKVFLHGDYCLGNIYISDIDGKPVILDWHATPKIGGKATYGTRYFDLMWFVYSLFYRPFNRQRYKIAAPASPMAREFLDGYFQTFDSSGCHEEFVDYMERFMAVKLAKRKRAFHMKRRLLLLPSHMKLRKFIRLYHPGRHYSR